METNDEKRQFDRIVANLTADYPSLAGRRRRSRRFLAIAGVIGGLAWALLSIAMVAWGAWGVVLTCATVALAGAGITVDAYRSRR